MKPEEILEAAEKAAEEVEKNRLDPKRFVINHKPDEMLVVQQTKGE